MEQFCPSAQARLFGQTLELVVQLPAWLHAPVVRLPFEHEGVPHGVDEPGYWQVPLASQPVAPHVPLVEQRVEQQWALGDVPRQTPLAQLPGEGGVQDWPAFSPHTVSAVQV
jgi:hypothetical protein